MPSVPLYPVTGHPLLGEDALALDAAGIREWGLVAERLLGLRGPDAIVFTGEAAEDAKRAVALQVSILAAVDAPAYLQESYGIGSESVDYRDDYPLHPYALAIVAGLLAENAPEEEAGDSGGWPVFGGWRGPRCDSTASAEQATAAANARRNRSLG